MGDSVGFCDDEELTVSENIKKLSINNIIPREGLFLGLDISLDSTGICLIENGKKITGNVGLEDERTQIESSKDRLHEEVLLRRELKKNLETLVSGKNFDLIVIEDVYSGINPRGVRILYALNTAIDELILDGVCSCKRFVRVGNGEWKKWLFKVYSGDDLKGLNDKVKIEKVLNELDVYEEGEGYQDRLDATGMIVAHFIEKSFNTVMKSDKVKSRNIKLSDLEFLYEPDTSDIFNAEDWLSDLKVVWFKERNISKKGILELINENPNRLFISEDAIFLGRMASVLGIDWTISSGGYLAFYVKKKKRSKLLIEG